MESRKTVLMNLFARQQWERRHENGLMDKVWEEEGGTNGESCMETYTRPNVEQICCVTQGAQPRPL